MGAMVEAPLACLHYESRGSLSDVLCDAIRIVLYARDGPFVWRKASRKFSGGHGRRSIKRGSSIHFRFARYFVRIATCYSWICALFCCYDDDNEGEHCYRERREFCFDIGEDLDCNWIDVVIDIFFVFLNFFSLEIFKIEDVGEKSFKKNDNSIYHYKDEVDYCSK